MNRMVRMGAALAALTIGLATSPASQTEAQEIPAKLTFLAATCPGSSSMYSRVANGQDPTSNENGSPADPADIAAYGCAPSNGLGFYLLGSSAADSLFLDESLTQSVVKSADDSAPSGATIVQSGTTAFAPGGIAQVRRVSLSNYPTTVVARAAMPVLDIQCLTDGVNSDNADGVGWNAQAMAGGSQNYCIAYVWDGVAQTPSPTPEIPTPTPTPTVTPSPTQSTTANSSPNATVTVNFPGLADVHTYAHAADGAAGVAGGKQTAASTWKSGSTTLSVPKGSYDIRVVHGPVTVVIDGADCLGDCAVDVPLATLTVSFPGLSDAHTYAHVSDGAAGTYGAQDSGSTWKANSASLTLLRGVYDVRVVHGPMQTVLDNIDCQTATCWAVVPMATLTVTFPGLSDAHTYAHKSDGAAGIYGAQDSSSTWKTNSTSIVLMQAVYDVRVVHGPNETVIDDVDCRAATCSATIAMATLTVNFPGLSDVHSYAHKTDGAAGTYGAQDSSSTWKSGSTTMVLMQAVYDVRVVHGPGQVVLDNIDCRAETCSVTAPMATLTVNFPGLTDAHTYVHMTDGAAGTYGAQDSSSTWRNNGTSLVLLQAVYDVRVVKGPAQTVLDAVDCRAATCSAEVPLAELTVNFPGHSNLHSYVRIDDGVVGTAAGAAVSSSTWKANSTSFVLLRGMYDVLMREGSLDSFGDGVNCLGATCSVSLSEANPAAPPATPTPTPKPADRPTVRKSFVSDQEGLITWRLEPSAAADLLIWDDTVTGCEEHGGATCGTITEGGNGAFAASGTGQYLLVTQKIEKDGDSCEVTNTAEWGSPGSNARESVSASYKCSGASTMGWGLFALFAAGAGSMAWVVHRKLAWSR